MDGGSMAPAGGHKGMLLALMVDVLAGGLAGPLFDYQVSGMLGTKDEPPRVGQFFIAIAPTSFAPPGRTGAGLGDRIEALLVAMTAEPGVRIPGARRLAHREVATRDGVSVPVELLNELEAYAAS